MEPNAATKKRKILLDDVVILAAPPPKIAKTNTSINSFITSCLASELEIDISSILGLHRLNIRDLNINAKRIQILCNALGSICSIEEAVFERCLGFDESYLEQLIAMLKKHNRLTRLDMTGCGLQDRHARMIFTFIDDSKSVQKLNLSCNKIQLNAQNPIILPLTYSTRLSELDLGDNPLNPNGETALVNTLLNRDSCITHLYLKNTKIGGVKLAKVLARSSTKLELLDLEGAKDENILAEIVLALRTNTMLKVLNLNGIACNNRHTFVELLRALKDNKSLIYLGLKGTNLPQEYVGKLEKYFQELRDLRQLSNQEKKLVLAITKGKTDDSGPQIVERDQNETWNFLEEKPDSLPAIRDGKRLNSHLHDAQEQMCGTLQKSFSQFEQENQIIDEQNRVVYSRLIETEKKIIELNKQLQELKKKLPARDDLVYAQIKALRMHLKFPIAKANIEKFKEETNSAAPRIHKLQEKIKSTALEEWIQSDVVELMKLINASPEAIQGVEQNGITGKLLIGLTTQDITNRLKMSFVDAKRLQTYILLLKNKKDIFVKFESPVLYWTNKRVLEWLEENNLQALVTPFKNKCITGQELLTIDSHDLSSVSFKIKTLAVKVAFEEAIKKLRSRENPFAESSNAIAIKQFGPKVAVKQETKKTPPNALLCPLTKQLMTDPVQLSDGHTYERSAIEKWLLDHDTSPVTHESLTSKQYFPSFAIKAMINEFNNTNNK